MNFFKYQKRVFPSNSRLVLREMSHVHKQVYSEQEILECKMYVTYIKQKKKSYSSHQYY